MRIKSMSALCFLFLGYVKNKNKMYSRKSFLKKMF